MNKIKQFYKVPVIKRIQLDNEIALALESIPAIGPGESKLETPIYFNTDPFKSNLA